VNTDHITLQDISVIINHLCIVKIIIKDMYHMHSFIINKSINIIAWKFRDCRL